MLTYPRGGTGEPRAVAVNAWYPAARGAGEPTAVYVTGGLFRVPSETAVVGAAVANGGPFPLVVYSHGGGGEAQHAYPFGELLASHGFVVVGITHAGTAALDPSPTRLERFALDRPLDISATLDWLEAPTDAAFEGLAATDRVMLVGYSQGAYTVFAASGVPIDIESIRDRCSDECDLLADGEDLAAGYAELRPDARVVALVVQATGSDELFVPGSRAELDIPLMLQSGVLDTTTPHEGNAVPLWNSRDRVGDLFVEMAMGAHLSFIPSCRDLDPSAVEFIRPGSINDGCSDRFIPVDDALRGLSAYTLGFARLHLRGETRWQDVLSGPPLGEGFTVTAR